MADRFHSNKKWVVKAVVYRSRLWNLLSVTRKARTQDDDRRLAALGRAIRDMRKAQKTSQEELAHRSNIDRSHMGRIERGERNVTALNLLRLADALKVPPSAIFLEADL